MALFPFVASVLLMTLACVAGLFLVGAVAWFVLPSVIAWL